MTLPPPVILEFAVRVSRDEVLRDLGYPRSSPARERSAARLEVLRAEAEALLAPRGAFRLVPLATAERAGVPRPTPQTAVGLVTIGPRLEERVTRLQTRGALVEALLLDAFGSAAAEAAADRLEAEIRRAGARLGLRAARRFSPGYGAWHVAAQQELLALLPAAELGVRLTPGMMMVPRKSVSFALRLRPSGAPAEGETDTARPCPLERCPYRRTPCGAEGTPGSSDEQIDGVQCP